MSTFLTVVVACWPLIAFTAVAVAAMVYAEFVYERNHR